MKQTIAFIWTRVTNGFAMRAWRCKRVVVYGFAALSATMLLQACTSLPPNTHRTPTQALPPDPTTPLVQLARQQKAAAASPHDNDFVLLDNADSAYASRLALIQQAQRSLDVQYYAIMADPSTRMLMLAIRDAARRGVRVRMLIDDIHVKGNNLRVLRLANNPHVEIRLFNPLPGGRNLGGLRGALTLSNFDQLQRRMHNKVFLADNVAGIVGGRNLGEAYFGQSRSSNFADMDVLVLGTLAADMSASFDAYWNHALAYPVERLVSKRQLAQLRPASSFTAAGNTAEAPFTTNTSTSSPSPAPTDLPPAMALDQAAWVRAPGEFWVDSPDKLDSATAKKLQQDTVVQKTLAAMQAAQHDVLLVSPYLVPDAATMAVLQHVRQRGVRVRILTNSLASTDVPVVHIGYARWRKQVLALGVELFEMRAEQRRLLRSAFTSSGKAQRTSLHAKVFVVDGKVLGVGSMNIDPRSNHSNSEVAVVMHSPTLAKTITGKIDEVLQKGAWRVSLRDDVLQWDMPSGDMPPTNKGEPDASAPLQMLIKMLEPLIKDKLL